MAESSSSEASVYESAHLGILLSHELYRLAGGIIPFGNDQSKNGSTIQNINQVANNIALVASSLKNIIPLLRATRAIQSREAVETAEQIAIEFDSLVGEVGSKAASSKKNQTAVAKRNTGHDETRADMASELRRHFDQSRSEGMIARLEYIRTTLAVFTETLSLAHMVAAERLMQSASNIESRHISEREEQARMHVETLIVARQLALNVIKHLETTRGGSPGSPRSTTPIDSDSESEGYTTKRLTQYASTMISIIPHDDGILSRLMAAEDSATSGTSHSNAAYVDQLLDRWMVPAEDCLPGPPDVPRPRRFSSPNDTNTSISGDMAMVQFEEPTTIDSGSTPSSPTDATVARMTPSSPRQPRRGHTLPGPKAINPARQPELLRAKSDVDDQHGRAHIHLLPGIMLPPPPPLPRPIMTGLEYPGTHLSDLYPPPPPGSGPHTLTVATRPRRRSSLQRHGSLPTNYQHPYVTAVTDSDTDTDTSNSTGSSSSRSPNGRTKQKRRARAAGREIPWRLVLLPGPGGGQASIWDFSDRYIVGPPERFAPGAAPVLQERVRQAYTPGVQAYTDISAVWINEESLMEREERYERIPDAGGRLWGWRVRRALKFREVEALVERSLAMTGTHDTVSHRPPSSHSRIARHNSQPNPSAEASAPRQTPRFPPGPSTTYPIPSQSNLLRPTQSNPMPAQHRSVSFSNAPTHAGPTQSLAGAKYMVQQRQLGAPRSSMSAYHERSPRSSGDQLVLASSPNAYHHPLPLTAPSWRGAPSPGAPTAYPRSPYAAEGPRERSRRDSGERPRDRDRDRDRDWDRDRERDRRREKERDRELRAIKEVTNSYEREKEQKRRRGRAAAAVGRLGGLIAMIEGLGEGLGDIDIDI